jgi:hypothetical protein
MSTQQSDQEAVKRRPQWERLGPGGRVLVATAAALFVLLFLLGWLLDPDPRGFGTHEQLGLRPCLTAWLVHVPCPFCGMTTAFSQMAHGHVVEAFVCQPAGALFFVSCVAGFLMCVAFSIRGQWYVALVDKKCLHILSVAALAVFCLAWIYKAITFAG